MYKGKRILAVVPARSGSKGLRDKNMKKIGGTSLIGLAGNVLSELPFLDAKIISTDSHKYAEEACKFSLDAPFLRPQSLAGDSANIIDVLMHATIESEQKYNMQFDIVLIIEPTSPMRKSIDIENTISQLIDKGADSAITVSHLPEKYQPLKLLVCEADAKLDYYLGDGRSIINRQELKESYYYRNGVCYALTKSCLFNKKSILTNKTTAIIIDRPVANIDDAIELEWAKYLIDLEKDDVCSNFHNL